jgi:hypothetical protein
MKTLPTIGVVAALVLLAFSCRYAALPTATDTRRDDTVPVAAVYRNMDCPWHARTPQARWIDVSVDLQRLWAAQQDGPGQTQPSMPEVDFSSQGLLLIHMGRRPTGGYAIALAEPVGRVTGDTLSVTVDWITPEADRATVQMITAPCLLLKLPRGRYRSIEVSDSQGRVRAVATLPTPGP